MSDLYEFGKRDQALKERDKFQALAELGNGYRRERDEVLARIDELERDLVTLANLNDKLRWVAQEARAVVMLGYTGPNHETLRRALASIQWGQAT